MSLWIYYSDDCSLFEEDDDGRKFPVFFYPKQEMSEEN